MISWPPIIDQGLKYPRNVLLNKFGSHIDSEFNTLERTRIGANTALLDFFDRIGFGTTQADSRVPKEQLFIQGPS